MNDIIETAVTMSSLELVDFINSQRETGEAELRHDNFMAKVPKVLGEKAAPKFLGTASYTVNGATRERPVYRFPKREACLMAMSYSYELQARVFDKMTALEQQGAFAALPDFMNPVAAARAWAEQAEQRQLLQHKVSELEPKAEALDRISSADGSFCIRDAAKALQLRPIDLQNWMLCHRWIYRRPGNAPLLGYQEKIQPGYLTHKVTTVIRSDGTDKVIEQVRITSKGLAQLAAAIKADIAMLEVA